MLTRPSLSSGWETVKYDDDNDQFGTAGYNFECNAAQTIFYIGMHTMGCLGLPNVSQGKDQFGFKKHRRQT